MAPNRHCKHFRPQAAATTQNGHKKNENFNFGNYAANKFQAWGQQLQAAAGAVTEGGGGAEVPLQGGAKFHVVATLAYRAA